MKSALEYLTEVFRCPVFYRNTGEANIDAPRVVYYELTDVSFPSLAEGIGLQFTYNYHVTVVLNDSQVNSAEEKEIFHKEHAKEIIKAILRPARNFIFEMNEESISYTSDEYGVTYCTLKLEERGIQ